MGEVLRCSECEGDKRTVCDAIFLVQARSIAREGLTSAACFKEAPQQITILSDESFETDLKFIGCLLTAEQVQTRLSAEVRARTWRTRI